MKALIETTQKRSRRVFLVAIERRSASPWETRDALDELAQLARAAGCVVMGEGFQRLESPVPATFIGKGKAEEFARRCKELGVDTVIFDEDLTPAQIKNLEKIFGTKIIDRTDLILEIFALRAHSRAGKLQVELAQLQHTLPRLARYWEHLSRQPGGIGVRGGEGEKQIEIDRRRILDRIARIKDELEEVQKQRAIQRGARQRNHISQASIVGYTNAGKSTLLNRLTNASVYAEDLLFCTLDPTTRRLKLPDKQVVLLSDTVGFIRKLPTQLVEAFKATLEEVVQADLLIHVVDVSHPLVEDQIREVEKVLKEIGAEGKPMIMVLNKIDRLNGNGVLLRLHQKYPDAIPISALTGQGLDLLLNEISNKLRPARKQVELFIPQTRPQAMARLYEVAQVLESKFDERGGWFRAKVPPHLLSEFNDYVLSPPSHEDGNYGTDGRAGGRTAVETGEIKAIK